MVLLSSGLYLAYKIYICVRIWWPSVGLFRVYISFLCPSLVEDKRENDHLFKTFQSTNRIQFIGECLGIQKTIIWCDVHLMGFRTGILPLDDNGLVFLLKMVHVDQQFKVLIKMFYVHRMYFNWFGWMFLFIGLLYRLERLINLGFLLLFVRLPFWITVRPQEAYGYLPGDNVDDTILHDQRTTFSIPLSRGGVKNLSC